MRLQIPSGGVRRVGHAILMETRIMDYRENSLLWVALALVLAWDAPARAAVYSVDAAGGGDYASLSSLLAVVTLDAGDVVEIQSGTYHESVHLMGVAGLASQPVTFLGVGPDRPVWDGGGTCSGTVSAQGRALWQLESSVHDVVIENIEWTNARCSATENAAGLRLVGAHDITVRGCRSDYNQNGIFASSHAANVLIEYCEVDHNGNNFTEQEHGFYIEIDGVTVQYCYIHDNAAGSNFKSRSKDDVFRYNWVENAGDFELDLVETNAFDTQDAYVYGNVIIQSDGSNNWNGQYEYPLNTGKVVKFGGDGGGTRNGILYFVNNTIIGGFANASLFQQNSPVVAVNNVYLAKSGWNGNVVQSAAVSVSGSNNWFLTGADLAGLELTGSILGAASDLKLAEAANHDYHILADSALRNHGTNTLPSPIVLDGHPVEPWGGGDARPVDATLDIGAYEYSEECTGPDACTAPPACRTSDGATCDSGTCVYPIDAGASCDDGDECTAGDACNASGQCVAGSNVCPACDDVDGDGYGDPASSDCTHPQADCDDDNPDVHPGQTEQCDGVDDNCDGVIDEGCSCTNGTTQSCYSGPAGTEGVGICQHGVHACSDGAWGGCVGEVTPAAEQCADSVDNDCDGFTDTADSACNSGVCVDTSTRWCYSGPAGTEGVGVCQHGLQTCSDGAWGGCVGEVTPASAENCADAADRDCDGLIADADPDCSEPAPLTPVEVSGCSSGTRRQSAWPTLSGTALVALAARRRRRR